ncbi:MAG: hypothetical protein VW082_01155 [Candidatus Nanopelagicales bacterium]|jgi:hypothetical protein
MGLTRVSLEGLSRRVAGAGFTALTSADLATLSETANAIGVSPILVDVLNDAEETEVVRERAFVLVSCAISGAVRSEHALAA